jgi:hypothetical protein
MNQHPEIKSKKQNAKKAVKRNALQNELTMFADQIDTVTVVIYLSRPQMAILDFDEKLVYNLRGKNAAMDHLPTKRKEERGDSHREP